MKTFCRILACLLAAIMFASVFAACGSSTTPTTEATKTEAPTTGEQTTQAPTADTTTAAPDTTAAPTVTPTEETTTPEPQKQLPKILKTEDEAVERFDEDGEPMVVNFYINGGEYGSLATRSIYVGADDEGNLPDLEYGPNKATAERNDTITNLIGTKIQVGKIGQMQGTYGELKPIFQSQEHVYDICALYQYFDLDLALKDTVGSFYNFENMPEDYTNYLDIEAHYWNKQIYDTMKLRDPDSGNTVCFFLTGDATQTNVGNMFVSYVNARMWDDYKDRIKNLPSSGGYSDIYDIVNNGYWTMDLWAEIADLCWQDTNANEKPDRDDQLGVLLYGKEAGINNMCAEWLSYGAYVRYTELDDTGKPVVACNSEHNMAAFRKIYKLYCECNTGTMPYIGGETEEEDHENYIMSFFARGNVLLTVNELKTAEEYLIEMNDDYYIMPLPMMDHNQFNKDAASLGYCSGLGDSLTQFAIVVYGGDERVPALTATLELMGFLGNKLVIPEYYDVALKTRFIRDEKNSAMLDTIHEGIYSCFGLIWSKSLMNVTWKLRENYADLNSMADNWKEINKSTKGSLKKLLSQIMTAWFVQYS